MQSRRSLKKEIESRGERIKELVRQSDKMYSEHRQLKRDIEVKDTMLAYLNTQVCHSNTVGFLKFDLENKIEFKDAEIRGLKAAIIDMQSIIRQLGSKIEELEKCQKTDWEKKYNKVIAKLDKITNKKPF